MPCAGHWISLAFEAAGVAGFRAYAYAHHDTLEAMLAPNYFAVMRDRFRPGDLIFCGCTPPSGPTHLRLDEAIATVMRRCLLMVIRAEAGEVRVRLVQDSGAVEERAEPVSPEPGSPQAAAKRTVAGIYRPVARAGRRRRRAVRRSGVPTGRGERR